MDQSFCAPVSQTIEVLFGEGQDVFPDPGGYPPRTTIQRRSQPGRQLVFKVGILVVLLRHKFARWSFTAERDSAISESHRLGSDLGVCRESLKASQDRAAEAETRAAASEGRAGEQQRQIESLTRQIETLQNKIAAQSPVVATPAQAGTTTRKVGSPATKVN